MKTLKRKLLYKHRRRINYLNNLNPILLYFGFFLCLFIPYMPNVPMYIIILSDKYSKQLKTILFLIALLFKIFYSSLLMVIVWKLIN